MRDSSRYRKTRETEQKERNPEDGFVTTKLNLRCGWGRGGRGEGCVGRGRLLKESREKEGSKRREKREIVARTSKSWPKSICKELKINTFSKTSYYGLWLFSRALCLTGWIRDMMLKSATLRMNFLERLKNTIKNLQRKRIELLPEEEYIQSRDRRQDRQFGLGRNRRIKLTR